MEKFGNPLVKVRVVESGHMSNNAPRSWRLVCFGLNPKVVLLVCVTLAVRGVAVWRESTDLIICGSFFIPLVKTQLVLFAYA